MARVYEVPLRLTPPVGFAGGPVRVEMDLPLLIRHLGEERAPDSRSVRLCALEGGDLDAAYLSPAGGAPGLLVAELPAGGARPLRLQVAAGGIAPSREDEAVSLKAGQHDLIITLDGQPFATYRYNTRQPDLPRPYFHPIIGPTGLSITQDGEFPGTRTGHFHHTGLVIAHQNFTDGNNWQIGPQFSRINHVDFRTLQSGRRAGRFVERLDWLNKAGDALLLREHRSVLVYIRPLPSRYVDVDILLTAAENPVTLNATPYHLLAIRVPDAMVPKADGGGLILNSEGQRQDATAGAPAKWLDFSGPLGNETVGVALFNAPTNFRHPTPFLNFENETVGLAPTYREPYTIPAGGTLALRYRVLIHSGDAERARVATEYEAYAMAVKAEIGPPTRVA
ncbi:MAG: PmoA family protein [Armatimonadetes bacterium]|nr:PmoA family protein [Armatimonadota bacterium]